jgi:acetolactate synthase-1/2/3 large subunit
VVWNNYAYASIRGLQRGYLKGRELATDFHNPLTGERYNPDFAAMARSAGVEGVRVDRAADLAEAVRKGHCCREALSDRRRHRRRYQSRRRRSSRW